MPGVTQPQAAFVVLKDGALTYQAWCNLCESEAGDGRSFDRYEDAVGHARLCHACDLTEAPEWVQEALAPEVVYLTTIEDVQALSASTVIELANGRYAEVAEPLEYFPAAPGQVMVYFFGQRDSWPIDKDDLPARIVK